jgi:hypothetical protein
MVVLGMKLSTGRSIWASSLFIEHTYVGLWVGHPSRKGNDRRLASLPNRAKTLFGDSPVHVLEPSRTIDAVHSRPWLEVELLPEFWVMAEFTSTSTDPDAHGSRLTLAWFQDVAFPIPSEAAGGRLSHVDWDALASDFED